MTPTRVLVADGMTVFRAAVCNVLAHEEDFDVIEAGTLGEVIGTIADRCVDIALVDLQLPPAGGLEAVQALLECCGTNVIVWSFRPEPETVFEAIRCGASGYMHKEISPDGLVRSLHGAANGEPPLSRELAALTIDALHTLDDRHSPREQEGLLSAREREVLGHVAAGARNREIASSLSISEFTVKRHVQNILHKLGVESRHEAAAFYRAVYAGISRDEAVKA